MLAGWHLARGFGSARGVSELRFRAASLFVLYQGNSSAVKLLSGRLVAFDVLIEGDILSKRPITLSMLALMRLGISCASNVVGCVAVVIMASAFASCSCAFAVSILSRSFWCWGFCGFRNLYRLLCLSRWLRRPQGALRSDVNA